jgi:hypothetical protein
MISKLVDARTEAQGQVSSLDYERPKGKNKVLVHASIQVPGGATLTTVPDIYLEGRIIGGPGFVESASKLGANWTGVGNACAFEGTAYPQLRIRWANFVHTGCFLHVWIEGEETNLS